MNALALPCGLWIACGIGEEGTPQHEHASLGNGEVPELGLLWSRSGLPDIDATDAGATTGHPDGQRVGHEPLTVWRQARQTYTARP